MTPTARSMRPSIQPGSSAGGGGVGSKRKVAATVTENTGAQLSRSKMSRDNLEQSKDSMDRGDVTMGKEKGILEGKDPTQVSKKELEQAVRDASTPQELFGNLSSSAMIEQIFSWFGDGTLDVPWCFLNGVGQMMPSVVASPHNRPLQETTVEEYQERMLKDGYHQDVAGAAWFQYQSPEKQLPVEAITFNHRREAFYRADKESPDAPPMVSTKATGLKQCKMLMSTTPVYLIKELVKVHNLSHIGSGVNIWDLIDHALDIEKAWTVHCRERGITSANGGAYAKLYEEYLMSRTDKFTSWKPYEACKALAHRLEDYQISKVFRDWCQCHMSFLDSRMNLMHTINTMHTAVNIISTLMKRFYDKRLIGQVMLETLKLTVPSKPRGNQRVLEWCLNKSPAENGVIINLMNIPMGASATFRKLSQAKDRFIAKLSKEAKDPSEHQQKRARREEEPDAHGDRILESASKDGLVAKLCEKSPDSNIKEVRPGDVMQEEAIRFVDSVKTLDSEDSRPKTALDDVLHCLQAATWLGCVWIKQLSARAQIASGNSHVIIQVLLNTSSGLGPRSYVLTALCLFLCSLSVPCSLFTCSLWSHNLVR